ncbi:MAG TPA: hypothetical protein PK228_04555 [Saprospiraceae bacterium]|nr:hypothetical protein [Saprospiraceae bacterium]
MRTRKLHGLLFFLTAVLLSPSLFAQSETATDSTGLPGDNFSLQAAIELFKKSESPEDFEKRLNNEDSKINNLDLNEDGEIDYIRVVDNMEGDAHAIILQVAVSEKESQDIAVIEIEKQGNENAVLQIVGDENIYGTQTIVEPFEEEQVKTDKNKGPYPSMGPVIVVVNVWLWPCVRVMYRPGYTVWVSPYRWHYYPPWFRPWHPYPYHHYHVYVAPYHAHCHVVTTHRVARAHTVYIPRRTSSTVVHTRTTTTVAARGKNGGTTVAKKTTTTSTAKAQNGRVTQQQTTTTKAAKQGPNGKAGAKKTTTTTKTTRQRGRH